MRFSVWRGLQNAFSVECAFPYLDKRDVTSRKGAFWPSPLTQKRILAVLKTPECALP